MPTAAEISLEGLKKDIINDVAFDHMRELKSIYVSGTGNTDNPPIMFIGEAPGPMENGTGIPFSGKAGSIFNRTLKNVTGFDRDQVYITNTVKYMPVNPLSGKFRKPSHIEVDDSRQYIEREIEIVNPKIVCLLGNIALRAVFPQHGSIQAMRGQILFTDTGRCCIPTLHPSYFQYPGKEHYKPLIESDFRKMYKLVNDNSNNPL